MRIYKLLTTGDKVPDNGVKNLLTPWKVHQFIQVVIKTVSLSVESTGTLTILKVCIYQILSEY